MKKTTKNTTVGMALGMCFGVAVGTAVESLGLAMGLCLGMLAGLTVGMLKDKSVNEQIEEKGYTIKAIEKSDSANEYTALIADKQGAEQTVTIAANTLEAEQFEAGDIVFINEDGKIEQAFDKEKK